MVKTLRGIAALVDRTMYEPNTKHQPVSAVEAK
jgi:hypothetical protein